MASLLYWPAITLMAFATTAAAEPGKPALTEQTKRSGGPMSAEQKAVVLDHVDLALEVLPQSESISGIATLDFIARSPLDRIVVDLDPNLPVSAIAVDGRDIDRSRWSNPEGQLTINLPQSLATGEKASVRITYAGKPHVAVRAPWDGGFVWSRTESGKPWIATAVQGEGCDLFWPCIDHPTGEPRTMTLHITVPAGLAAPSNGALKAIRPLPDGRTTYDWEAKNPNTYGIALNVGPYKLIKADYRSRYGNVIPMEYWHLEGREKQAAGLFAEFAPMLDFFEATIGPYPFGDEKVGVVETPYLGMEHQTINGYGNNYAKQAIGFDWLLQHEFAHEWFANQLTVADWDDFWLHEGFGTYMQPLYGRWREGEARYAAMLDTHRSLIVNKFPIVSGSPKTESEVYDPKSGPANDIYYKAAWMLHTLRNLIGDPAFFDATRRLVYGRPDPKPGNFTPRYSSTGEFQKIVRDVIGRDYDWFFDAYLHSPDLPELIEERTGDRLTLRWKTAGGRPFPLPVEVQIADRIEKVAMTGGQGTISVPQDAHVVIDPNARILRRSKNIEALQAWQLKQGK